MMDSWLFLPLGVKCNEYLFNADSIPYGDLYLKTLLMQRYANSIFIAEGDGLDWIVTIREKTSDILRSYFNNTKQNRDERLPETERSEKGRLLETAAKLIKSDIMTNVPPVNEYPTTDTLKLQNALDYIPKSLHIMLKALFVGNETNWENC